MPEDKNMAEEKVLAKLKSLLCMLESESCSWSQIKKVSEELVPELKLHPANERHNEEYRLSFLALGLRLLCDKRTPIDLALICGNAMIKMQVKHDFSKWFSAALQEVEGNDFAFLCLATGCLNHGPKEESCNSLYDDLCQKILQSCQTPSNHSYQSFQALRLWSLKSKQSDSAFLRRQPETLRAFLAVINANWENPLRGVCDLLMDSLANVLENVKDRQLDQELLSNTLKSLSWKTKAKYPLLCVLLPRVGVLQTLEAEGEPFAKGLAESLSSNHLASAGASVYKIIIKSPQVLESWQRWLLGPLVHSLCHDESKLVRCNTRNHWLNPSLCHLPALPASSCILKKLCSCDHCNTARFLILKGLRVNGHHQILEAEHINSLSEGLVHSSSDVRMAAFAALCHVKKKGLVPSVTELLLVHEFVRDNLSVDEASFRQALVSDFTQFMLRCRDCCISLLKKGGEQCEQLLMPVVQQINALMECLFDNMFPGANYQRLICSLELLAVMQDCFFCFKPCGMNKGSRSGDPAALVQHAQDKYGMMHFYDGHHLSKLLVACVLHYMIDVKSLASEILAHFPAEPLVVGAAFEKALLCSLSSKFSDCESAALLFKLCYVWKKHFWTTKIGSEKVIKNKFLAKAIEEAENEGETETLSQWLLALFRSLATQRHSAAFMEMARKAPMHGLLTSLRTSMDLERLPADFYSALIDQLEKSVDFNLAVLSGGSKNASFAEMGISVENMIPKSESHDDDAEEVCISDEHSLVLACAWLNLKECCLVASKLYAASSTDVVERAGHLITTVLTGTRHKGALEAAASALANLCSHLLSGCDKDFLPEKWLLRVMTEMETSPMASITRRSAGLPMLIRAIVSSEPRGNASGRRLLSSAINGLLGILQRTGEVSHDENAAQETRDLPQCHALHVLKSLIHDSSLSHDVLPHLPVILRQCVLNFHSPFWALRNAALQLFGALMPRLLGQKKLRAPEDEAEDTLTMYNAVTAQELFARHNQLAAFLLQQLKHCQSLGVNQPGSLVPILSMLSRVSPGLEEIPEASQFQMLFLHYLNDVQIVVRKLAAKSFISFTTRQSLMATLTMLKGLLASNLRLNNFVNGCLLALTYGVRLIKHEFTPEMQEASGEKLIQLVQDLTTETQLCSYNRLLLHDLRAELFASENLTTDNLELQEKYHPGARDLLIKYGQHGAESNNLDDCKRFIHNFDSNKPSVPEILQFMSANMHLLTGPMFEQCNNQLQSSKVQILDDCELAMDVITLLTDGRIITEKQFGVTAAASSIATAALAFKSMLLKEDFGMFFGNDGSTYVTLFCELADMLVAMARPIQQEVIRLYAGDFLLECVDLFTQRITCQLTIHMRYGLVQVVNAALILLGDENGCVRQKAVTFVSRLNGIPLERVKAMQKLAKLGLDYFEDCAEYLLPIVQLSQVEWTLIDCTENSQLFESGDGINVYEEEAFAAGIYFNVLTKWLMEENKAPTFRLLHCPRILENARQYGTQVDKTNEIFGPFINPKVYANAYKIHCLLHLVSRWPALVKDELTQENCAELKKLSEKLGQILNL